MAHIRSYSNDLISDRLRIEEYNGNRIIFVDYTGLKEVGMIELVKMHLELTKQTKLPFIADFHNTYATPGYMIEAKIFVQTTKAIIDKGAFLGIDKIKSYILKGIMMAYGVNYKSFDSMDKAIYFLTEGNG